MNHCSRVARVSGCAPLLKNFETNRSKVYSTNYCWEEERKSDPTGHSGGVGSRTGAQWPPQREDAFYCLFLWTAQTERTPTDRSGTFGQLSRHEKECDAFGSDWKRRIRLSQTLGSISQSYAFSYRLLMSPLFFVSVCLFPSSDSVCADIYRIVWYCARRTRHRFAAKEVETLDARAMSAALFGSLHSLSTCCVWTLQTCAQSFRGFDSSRQQSTAVEWNRFRNKKTIRSVAEIKLSLDLIFRQNSKYLSPLTGLTFVLIFAPTADRQSMRHSLDINVYLSTNK